MHITFRLLTPCILLFAACGTGWGAEPTTWFNDFARLIMTEPEVPKGTRPYERRFEDKKEMTFTIPLKGETLLHFSARTYHKRSSGRIENLTVVGADGGKTPILYTGDENHPFGKNVVRISKIGGLDKSKPQLLPISTGVVALDFILDGTETAITGTIIKNFVFAEFMAVGEARRVWNDHRLKAMDEVNAIFKTYTDEQSQAEMRYILPKAKDYLLAEDPMAIFRKLPFEKAGVPAKQIEALKAVTDIRKCGPFIRALVEVERSRSQQEFLNPEAMELSIRHLMKTYPEQYPNGESFLKELKALKEDNRALAKLRFRALVEENPLLKGKTLMTVRRRPEGVHWERNKKRGRRTTSLGMFANWQGLSSMGKRDMLSEVVTFPATASDTEKHLYKHTSYIGYLTLHHSADRLLFTSTKAAGETHGNWHVYELNLADGKVSSVTATMPNDTDSYDACYTATDGRVIFVNSSGYQGVPCVLGQDYVGNLHLLDRKTQNVRRLCFDQDNNWNPTLMPNGRIMYTRWEYTDSAHYFSRVLMHMNPDGTDQKEFYGSNSYWPNSLFYARPVPGSNTKFFGIVSGHHGIKQVGELYLFDVQRGRQEATGAVQQLPGYKKPVKAPVRDNLVSGTRPLWIHPRPLSEAFTLIARAGGGIYLMDVFDNIVPIKISTSWSHYEPILLEKKAKPRELPDRVHPESKEAVAFVQDVYRGRGMRGVARGTVKGLRVYRYEYSPRRAGGHYAMGMESGWDVKILLGTTPVQPDGSAMFKIPANAPIAIQPLDKDGQALQQMRSWLTAMPGETISCIGCHESQNEAPPTSPAAAARKAPQTLRPFYGEARGFGFMREVQPVLDKYCIGCHDGSQKDKRHNFADLSTTGVKYYGVPFEGWTKSYVALHPYVRRNGPEGDYTGLTPLEFHADTSPLIQLLKKGHHGVSLPREAMDRLVTWIDLNAPFHNSWIRIKEGNTKNITRRYELRKKYGGIEANYEAPVQDFTYKRTETFVKPKAVKAGKALAVKGFPFAKNDPRLASSAKKMQALELAEGLTLNMVKIPAGTFPMGSVKETPAEQPMSAVTIAKPFWMGETEISLAQYQAFDPTHKNGYYDMHFKDQVKPGYTMDRNKNVPAIRVSWEQATAFCAWLSKKTGKKVTLPTEAQWEWAARAGTASSLFYGNTTTDFAKQANLADVTIKELAVSGINPRPMKNPGLRDFVPKVATVDDGYLHLAPVGHYSPNGFGLKNMAGNVAEWTRSIYKPYPYNDTDGRNSTKTAGADRVIRGGSWRDRPQHATSSWRWRHPQWQRVYNVGFRVVIEE